MDHVKDYKPPKEFGNEDNITMKVRTEGCAPTLKASSSSGEEDGYVVPVKRTAPGVCNKFFTP